MNYQAVGYIWLIGLDWLVKYIETTSKFKEINL